MLTSLFDDLSPALAMPIADSLADAIASVYGFLTEFAKREDFFDKSEFVFGETLDQLVLSELRDQWVVGDFSGLPDLKLLSASDLQGANAAFAGSTGEIYLSTDFLSQYVGIPQVLAAVLLEEVGHSVDWKVNAVDTVGDEGAIFASTVLGQNLDPSTLTSLRQEDDSKVLNLGGSTIFVEQSIGTTTYSTDLSFGEFVFHATTAEYLNKFLGTNINNSWEYDSEDSLKYTYNYSSKTVATGVDLQVASGSAGFIVNGGSISAGVEAKAGYNLGEIHIDLPLSPSLDAYVSNSTLIFDFSPDFTGQFDYTSPFAYASLAAVLDYQIGSVKSFIDVNALGDTVDVYNNQWTLISPQNGSLSYDIINLDTREDEQVINIPFLQKYFIDTPDYELELFNGLVTLGFNIPTFDPEVTTVGNETEFSLGIEQEQRLMDATLSIDSLLSMVPQLRWMSGDVEKEFSFLGNNFEFELK